MNKKDLFFVDAETNGLYGSFLTVAIIHTDCFCNEIERYYWGIKPENMIVTDEWTRNNVLPILGDYVACENEYELLERVWAVWETCRERSYAVAYVAYPVEARLFSECVRHDEANRKFNGPFPLIDLSSILYTKGLYPLTLPEESSDQTDAKQHNALYDVEQMILTYKKIMEV